MGLPQPKVSALLRGDLTNLSERKLMDVLNRLGYDIEITVAADGRSSRPPDACRCVVEPLECLSL